MPLMDLACKGDCNLGLAWQLGYEPVVPDKLNRRQPWTHDAHSYNPGDEIERLFGRLRRVRRIATRYDEHDVICLSGTFLEFIQHLLPLMRTSAREKGLGTEALGCWRESSMTVGLL